MKNQTFKHHLENLDPSKDKDYSLWLATKKLKQPTQIFHLIHKINNDWVRNNQDKADFFTDHLSKVFILNSDDTHTEENIHVSLETPFQMSLPISRFKVYHKNDLNPKTAPGYNLISGRVLKESTQKSYKLITYQSQVNHQKIKRRVDQSASCQFYLNCSKSYF